MRRESVTFRNGYGLSRSATKAPRACKMWFLGKLVEPVCGNPFNAGKKASVKVGVPEHTNFSILKSK